MTLLLAISFFTIFAIAFGVAGLTLRTPAEQRNVERRLEVLVPDNARVQSSHMAGLLKEAKSGQNAGLLVWAEHLKPIRRLESLLFQATGNRSVGPTLLATGGFGIVGIIAVQLTTGMAPIAALAGVLLGALPTARLYFLRQQRLKAFEAALPDCIDMCARALRAGHSLIAAIGMVAEQAAEPAKTEFAEVFKKQNYGLPLRDALLETLERVPSADLRVFVTGIFVQKDTGGNLTEIFDRIVHVIRERMRIKGEIKVHTAQGRMTAWILTLLPVGLLVIINLIDPGYSRPMFKSETGRKLLYLGAALLLTGGLVVRRIVNGIEV